MKILRKIVIVCLTGYGIVLIGGLLIAALINIPGILVFIYDLPLSVLLAILAALVLQ